jgi:8-amino-3,8-dideoxy-alpha-D-manno-octulosonate transaminase
LSVAQSAALKKLNTQDFSRSDEIMGCCISTAIGLSWTDAQLRDKATVLTSAIKTVLAKNSSQTTSKTMNAII